MKDLKHYRHNDEPIAPLSTGFLCGCCYILGGTSVLLLDMLLRIAI